MSKALKITCDGTRMVSLKELVPLQGNLKTLSEANLKRIMASMLRFGFSFPFYVWANKGKVYVEDGHQRLRALEKLAEEGYQLPKLFPAVNIEADDIKQARQKILLISSSYGHMSPESLHDFLEDSKIELSSVKDLLDLPQINLNTFEDLFSEKTQTVEEPPEQWLIVVTCKDEQDQKQYLEKFMKENIPCKALAS